MKKKWLPPVQDLCYLPYSNWLVGMSWGHKYCLQTILLQCFHIYSDSNVGSWLVLTINNENSFSDYAKKYTVWACNSKVNNYSPGAGVKKSVVQCSLAISRLDYKWYLSTSYPLKPDTLSI